MKRHRPWSKKLPRTRCIVGVIRIKIKFPSKLGAIDKLAKLRGRYAPDKVSLEASDPLMAVLARARQRK